MERVRLSICTILAVAAVGTSVLGATQTFYNYMWFPIIGIRITFSSPVSIAGYDKGLFSTQEPLGVTQHVTFQSGTLPFQSGFRITWREEYAVVEHYEWLPIPDSSNGLQYPVDFGIDYAHPEKYLAQGEQSQISNPAVLDSLRGGPKGLAQLGRIYKWLVREFTKYNANGTTHGVVTVDELLASRRLGGCHDYALVYSAVARGLGYPALMLDTNNVKWIARFQGGDRGVHAGHVFVEVFLIDRWVLIDTTRGYYVEHGYDPLNPAIAMPGKGFYGESPVRYFVMRKGIDARAYGIDSGFDEIHRMMESFALQVNVTAVVYPAYVWRKFAT